jgi:glycosyltransferase involved in cell wall biosynthesis
LVSTDAPALAPHFNHERHADPTVSVIVPTRNRAEYVRQLLDALAGQSYAASKLEVIVVDNDSTDNIEAIVREAAEHSGRNIRYVRKRNDGPAASRNRGAELATGEILAFTDSDCLPAANWLTEGVHAFDRPEIGVVCGPIIPVDVGRGDPFFVHQILPVTREEGLFPTANVFYRRECFLRLGGFDETLRTYPWGQPIGGDDTEFAWRVKRSGYQSAFVASASVRHQASEIAPHQYMLNSLQAQILPRMVRTAPELRDMCLYRRYLVTKNNGLFLLLLVGAALARKQPYALALGLPWLRSVWPILTIDAWPPKRWPRMALRLALHLESSLLLEAALIYGSVRNRRLVL